MVDQLTELPLPGRTFVAPAASATIASPSATLPSFVAGPENRRVAAVVGRLLEAASEPRRPALLALYGPPGTGKTHLARGIVRYLQQRRGPETAQYITALDFRRELTAAIEAGAVAEFRRQMRGRQLLAIDDLDRLPGDRHLLEELRHTLDALEEAAGAVVVTSARPAGMLANLSPDLRSRLAAGLILQLAAPGEAARQRLVEQCAAALGRSLTHDAACGLAANLRGTANHVFGAVSELCTAAPRTHGASLDQERTEHYLARRNDRRPTLHEIIAVVAKYCRLPQKVMKSSSRKQSSVFARATAIYLARELAGTSYENIGRALGGRDHTTIMHSYRKIRQDAQHDLATQESLEELRRILLST